MKITELTKIMNENYIKRDKKRKSIERLQKQLHKLDNVSWINVVIKPIAKELSELLNLPVWEILGPFGLCSEVSIHFCEDEKSLEKVEKIKSIHFRSHFNEEELRLSVIDYSKNTEEFAENTIGNLNGMNYPSIDVTDKPIKSLLEWVA